MDHAQRSEDGIYPWGPPGEMVDPRDLETGRARPFGFLRRTPGDGKAPDGDPGSEGPPGAAPESAGPRTPEREPRAAARPPAGVPVAGQAAFPAGSAGGSTAGLEASDRPRTGLPPLSAFPGRGGGGFAGSAAGAATPTAVDPSERTLGAVLHLLSFVGYLVPLGNIAAPLVTWLIKKDESPFLDHQGRQVLDFQITMTLLMVLSVPLMFVLIGIPMALAVLALDVILTIVAAVKVADGEAYRYPFALRFLSE